MDQLFRQPKGAMLGGVCGGLAEYFRMDATLVRIVFLLFAVLTGFGILAYLALWVILPVAGRPSTSSHGEHIEEVAETLAERASTVGEEMQDAARRPFVVPAVAVALIAFGAVLLLHNLGVSWAWWATPGTLWPALPILVGLAFLWKWVRGGGSS
jgi:phage shock protein C